MLSKFRQRSSETERLDRGEFTPEEYARWHHEMWWVHRIFGERRALRRTFARDIETNGGGSLSVLDVGAGSGDMLAAAVNWLGKRTELAVAAESSTLAAKASASAGYETVICDGLELPFSEGSFDYVMCSLTLHHFSDPDAVRLLREMRRVARKKIYVIDLHRSPVAYYFYRIFGGFFLQKFTRDDGALSILRSFRPPELLELGERAGLDEPKVVRSAAYRLVLIG